MKLRNNTLLIVGVTIICLVLILYVISNFIFIKSLTNVEEDITYNNVGIVNNYIFKELSELNASSYKWGHMGYFSPQSNITDNYTEQIISGSQVDYIMVLNSNNQVTYAKSFNSSSKTFNNIPKNVQTYISSNQQLTNNTNPNSNPEGVLLLNNQTILISSNIINPVNGNDRGTLILGTNLNPTEINNITSNQNNSVSFIPFSNPNNYPNYEGINPKLTQNSPIWTQSYLNTVQGVSILRNNQGEAVLQSVVNVPHNIINNAYLAFDYLIGSFILAGSILAMIILVYIDQMVLIRLKSLCEGVRNITRKLDFSTRLPVVGGDELSLLATNINKMLESVEVSSDTVQKSHLKYKSIFNNTGTAMSFHEYDGKFSMVNSEFEKISCYSKEEILGKKNWEEFLTGDLVKFIKKYDTEKLKELENSPKKCKTKFIDGNGEIKNVILTITSIPSTENILISYMDITELNNTLKEKELLVREVHHRVKNNLQIISSLLNLQSRYINDDESIEALRESDNRVKSMSMVHEGLYCSKNLSNINFQTYLKNLITQLSISYGIDQDKIKINLEILNIKIAIDTAIPLGLLITEILTNSIKYAFPNGIGKIDLLFSNEEDHYKMILRDNGIGMVIDNESKPVESLGLQLIKSLSQQLDAQMDIDTNNGTKYTIIFTDIKYKERF